MDSLSLRAKQLGALTRLPLLLGYGLLRDRSVLDADIARLEQVPPGTASDIGPGFYIQHGFAIGSVTVGAGSVVGANAVVVRDVPPSSTAVGVPAHHFARRTAE